MEKFKENIEIQKEKNLVSTILMVCFMIFSLAVFGAFSADQDDLRVTKTDTESVALLK